MRKGRRIASASDAFKAYSASYPTAGFTAEDFNYHPSHGALLTATGVRKLSYLAPDPARGAAVRDRVTGVIRSGIKLIGEDAGHE